jgi:hypothetical protein
VRFTRSRRLLSFAKGEASVLESRPAGNQVGMVLTVFEVSHLVP